MKNINILKIRKKLDKIDIKILNTIKQRSLLVDKILKLKKNKNEVIDQKRINFILKRIKRYSLKAKIDPAICGKLRKIIPSLNLD